MYSIPKMIKIPVELSVAHLLLLHSELLPVTLLLGPQGSNFTLILLEPVKVQNYGISSRAICTTSLASQDGQPDCWERGNDTVNVGDLAVATIPHNFPTANVNLGESKIERKIGLESINLLLSKGLASNGVTASILANCQFAPLGGKHTVFSHQSSHPVYLKQVQSS